MQIGIEVMLAFQSSNIKDDTETLEQALMDCVAPVFQKPRKLQSDDWVFQYTKDEPFTPKTWTLHDADRGVYDVDEVVWVPCSESGQMAVHAGKLLKIVGKKGAGLTDHRRPKEPEEYAGWDEGIDFANYKQRYMRVPSKTTNGWKGRNWDTSRYFYCLSWECRCNAPETNCWVWMCKDKNYTSYNCANIYQRKYLTEGYSTKYNAGTDIKAKVYAWGSPNQTKEDIIMFQSMIERNGYFYFRTQINAPIEYNTWITGTGVDYMYSVVTSPSDIVGFTPVAKTNQTRPFDGKAYTRTQFETSKTGGKASWSVLNTAPFNSIAFGYVVCDKIDLRVIDPKTNKVVFELNNYLIDNNIGKEDNDLQYGVTRVLYMPKVINDEHIIEITLYGDAIELGEIVGSNSVDAGFTKVSFKNNFKDFTPKEQDQWGNWDYIDNGIKVKTHQGTVEFPIMRYDELNRLMLKVGGGKVIVNSSDSTANEAPDGHNIFDATMMIARFTKFDLDTTEKHKRIGELARYSFNLEELV